MENQVLNISLLFVEDEEVARKGISEMISRRVGSFFVAENATEAIEIYKKQKPDLVLSDIQMPGMNGLQMAEKIKQVNPHVKLIMMSAFTDTNYLLTSVDMQVDGYIVKPVNKQKLIATIKKQADIIHLERKLKEQEQEIISSENNMRTLFNAMTDIVFEMDYDGRYINIAPTSSELMFKPSEDLIGKTVHEVFLKPEADRFLEFVRKCLDENKIITLEYPLVIKNKTTWFEGRATPKTKNSVLYIARDITKCKQVQEQIKDSLQQIEMINANTPNIIWKAGIDKNGDFINTYISQVADEFLALPTGTINNSWDKYFSYIVPKYLPTITEIFEQAITNTGMLISFDYEVNKADGKKAWFSSKGRVQSENDKLTVYGSTVDITERKQAEKELQKYRNHLEELVKKRTKKIEAQNEELERFNKLFVGREFRIKELKDKVIEYENKYGKLKQKT
ncbi:MAG: response regulator [Bacteroidales bacterium]|nr:response regulator [Bacteroidales bacterium]